MMKSEPIAIVGMSCLFPGSSRLDTFWRSMQEGRAHFREVPLDRWNHRAFYSADRRSTATTYARKIAYLDDIRSFGPEQYDMPSRRAYPMDPQQRLFLDQTRLALDDAGYRGRQLPPATGVYVGASAAEYRDVVAGGIRARQIFGGEWGISPSLAPGAAAGAVRNIAPIQKYSMVGVLSNMIACNVSAAFDLRGPASVIDAACSSALLAVHEAVLHLRAGVCDAAIVGGAYTICTPDLLVGFGRIGALSESDVCRPFDQQADGFVLGEGVGVVVLKRLEDAVRDQDHVWAVVAGVGLSNDGRGEGPMTPRLSGQVDALARAYRDADVPPHTVGYIEAHGTATPVSDLTEIRALKENARTNGEGPIRCAVASVKGNVGHTLAASGIAGLIRATLAINHKIIPPQAGLRSVRAELGLEGSGFHIPTMPQVFEAGRGLPRRAGVNAFGIGGTNVHVVLEEQLETPGRNSKITVAVPNDPQLFVISAATPDLLATHLTDLIEAVKAAATPLQDLAYALTVGRRREHACVTFVAGSPTQLIAMLEGSITAIDGIPTEGVFYVPAPLPEPQRSVAFLFPEKADSWSQDDVQIARRFPAFRARFDAIRSTVGELLESPSPSDFHSPTTAAKRASAEGNGARPRDDRRNFAAAQLALVDLLADFGLRPDAALGCGSGELVALKVGGILEEQPMLHLLARLHSDLHSSPSADAHYTFQAGAEELQFSTSRVPVISSFTAAPYPDDPDVVWRILGPAGSEVFDLAEGIRSLRGMGVNVFVQFGSGSSPDATSEIFPSAGAASLDLITLLDAHAEPSAALLRALGKLIALGIPLELSSLFVGARMASLPGAPVPTRPYWVVAETNGSTHTEASAATIDEGLRESFSALPEMESALEEGIATGGAGQSENGVRPKILALISQLTGRSVDSLQPDLHLDADLGFDSLMRLDFYEGLLSTIPEARALPESFLSEETTIKTLIRGVSAAAGSSAPGSRLRFLKPEIQRSGVIPLGDKAPVPGSVATIDARNWRIEEFPEVKALQERFETVRRNGTVDPYFSVHEGVTNESSIIAGREYLNFSSYNYLGLSGDPGVTAAAIEALTRYGTSVSASRLVSGEKPLHRELEREIADFLGCEDAVAMVSGHATNVSVIGHLLGPDDLVFPDSLAHDSILTGIRLSGAKRHPFPHNDPDALDQILRRTRHTGRRALIAIEGVYSMDGDIAPLARIVELKRRHKALLLVDEAHSLGVLGRTGRGIAEQSGVSRGDVDLWMGTLSKSLASCGGYIAGSRELIRYLKYSNPGFVFSVGISPANTAAALAALRKLRATPALVATLQERSRMFLDLCRAQGIDTGLSTGTAIVPCILGNSWDSLRLSSALAARGINVQPILHPAVEERLARLRFFVTARHTPEQIRTAAVTLAEELAKIDGKYISSRSPVKSHRKIAAGLGG
jgi:8-amino-7-oxononanoate synthase